MARTIPPDGLRKDKMEKIREDLFVTRLVKQGGDAHRLLISQMHEAEGYDLRITEDDLLTAMEKCDPRKVADVDGISGEIVKIITEQRPGRFLDLLNNINRLGVVLLPKPAKDPLLSSSYRPINFLPALSKVWEHTCKILIERNLRMDPFHKEQYRFRRRRSTIDALDRVYGIAEACRKKGLVCILVALDVKIAFNTLS
jgi:hypothetical protein